MQNNVNAAPIGKLGTNKGWLKYVLLSAITFGIYGIVVMSTVSSDINVVASRYDGKKTMHYCLQFFVLAPITCGISLIVWTHNLCNRIGAELKRRGIAYDFSAADFWLWCVLGSLIVVGPFIYLHKMFTAVNKMNEHYNIYG